MTTGKKYVVWIIVRVYCHLTDHTRLIESLKGIDVNKT